MDPYEKRPISAGAQKYFERVKDLIHYCDYDQPYDEGNVVWLWGEKAELGEVLADMRIPDRYIDEVAHHMACRGCGHDSFDRYSDIGLIDPIDAEIQKKIAEADRKYKKRIDELLLFIEKYPALALKNSLAKDIYKHISSGEMATCAPDPFDCYRCRLPEEGRTFNFEDIHAPKEGIATAGRYNHSGQSVLYVAEDLVTAVREVSGLDKGSVTIWQQKYHVSNAANILDLTTTWEGMLKLSTLFTAVVNNRILERIIHDRRSTWKPEYLLTNFVADCAKLAGYRGLKYPAMKGFAHNYVFFNPADPDIQPAEKHSRINYTFKERWPVSDL